jgi:hypothetical protein
MTVAIGILSAVIPSLFLLWFFNSWDVNPAPGWVIWIHLRPGNRQRGSGPGTRIDGALPGHRPRDGDCPVRSIFPLLTLRELDRAGQKVSFTEVLIVLGLSSMFMAVLMVEGLLPSSFCASCEPRNCA